MDEIKEYLLKKIKLNEKDIIVVGVSAGPDSMALLYILKELQKIIPYKIVVAHVNHNVRKESYEEKDFLEEYCHKNNLLFESMIIEKYGDDNFQNEARNIRYQFYEDLINKYQANYLMTGHHGDDLIETILMRIVRGSTLNGYSGFNDIVEMGNYTIVRPLIFVTKKELEDFDKEKRIPYRIDQSNFKDKYTRNRYRMNLLPFLKKEDMNVHKKFLKFSKTLSECDMFIERLTIMEMEKVYVDNCILIDEFKKVDSLIGKRIIEHILGNIYKDDLLEISDCHIVLFMKAINSKKASLKYNLPNDYLLIKEYNKIFVKKTFDEIMAYDIELNEEVFLPNGFQIKKISESDKDGNDILRINKGDVLLPLRVRTRKIGDKMSIKNMEGTKKVSDILINSKVPLSKRDTWPIVVDSNDKIIWIPKIKKSKYNRLKTDKCDIIYKCL